MSGFSGSSGNSTHRSVTFQKLAAKKVFIKGMEKKIRMMEKEKESRDKENQLLMDRLEAMEALEINQQHSTLPH